MKRLYIVLGLILVLAALAMPAIAQADAVVFTPDGWTWDES
jgi:hypothetical protein